LRQGSDAYPDQSATCVIEVHNLHADEAGWRLQGPGILGERSLRVQGLAADFPNQWSRNHASFPCGVDVFLATATHIVGLPRSTRIIAEES
jgi:alpha-D-ribose 1-methylphosphonate 5-triphosphate synthase subunit PhnH